MNDTLFELTCVVKSVSCLLVRQVVALAVTCMGLWLCTACTINVYHVDPEKIINDASLVIPESPCDDVCEANNIRTIEADGREEFSVLEMNADRVPGDIRYQVGDSVVLRVRPSVDAYVHCFYQMANDDIVKIFPNQQNAKSWLYSGQLMAIPERAAFKIVPDTRETTEAFLCLASAEDLTAKLPDYFGESLLQPLPVFSFDEIYRIYRDSTIGNLVGRVVTVEIL